MRIDVVMPTYNSNKGIFPLVLESIRRYVPLNRLIVVDRYSSDGTVELIKEKFPDALIIQTSASLGYARYIGIKFVETEWFAFIDSDVIVLPQWFRVLSGFMKHERIGAVEGSYIQLADILYTQEFRLIIDIYKYINNSILDNQVSLIKYKLPLSKMNILNILKNGLTDVRPIFNNSLIRTEAVKDWVPNPYLNAYEDLAVAQHIIRRGYYWLTINIPLVLHGNPPRSNLNKLRASIRKGLWEGAGIKYTGIPRDFVALYTVTRLLGALYRLVRNKDPFNLAMRIAFLLSLPSNKYLVVKR
ncbi:glycosyltransferase family 2 protein [Vulcanisaeta distributa]|uniref:Glycosyl transferase family 2 n=1 Tax=Vulcanisaeta distributa (strain DSM 14429 / JCM 11212 / NBRC 100878 / IC-017) TaxID=572478 RepID=E1QUD2_VULDI|nr:glycosyl transferase family 2 [Vulcanisaeta distributa DSM 14429]